MLEWIKSSFMYNKFMNSDALNDYIFGRAFGKFSDCIFLRYIFIYIYRNSCTRIDKKFKSIWCVFYTVQVSMIYGYKRVYRNLFSGKFTDGSCRLIWSILTIDCRLFWDFTNSLKLVIYTWYLFWLLRSSLLKGI